MTTSTMHAIALYDAAEAAALALYSSELATVAMLDQRGDQEAAKALLLSASTRLNLARRSAAERLHNAMRDSIDG